MLWHIQNMKCSTLIALKCTIQCHWVHSQCVSHHHMSWTVFSFWNWRYVLITLQLLFPPPSCLATIFSLSLPMCLTILRTSYTWNYMANHFVTGSFHLAYFLEGHLSAKDLFSLVFYCISLFYYCIFLRDREVRGNERERNIDVQETRQCVVAPCMPSTRDQAGNTDMHPHQKLNQPAYIHRRALNLLSHISHTFKKIF